MKNLCAALLCALALQGYAMAQTVPLGHRLTVWAAQDWNDHAGTYTYGRDTYHGGTATAVRYGVGGEWVVMDATLLGAELAVSPLDATFDVRNAGRFIIDDRQRAGIITNTFSAAIPTIAVDIYAKQRIVGPLFVNAGLAMNVPFGPTYVASERVLIPADSATYGGDVAATYEAVAGDLVMPTVLFGILAGIQMEIPLLSDRSFLLVPTVRASLGLSTLGEPSWTVNAVRAGLGIMWQYGLE